jgi:hypothetical protein
MDHQIAVIEAVFGLRIEGDKVILRLAFTGHHADIVTAHQRIQPGNAGQRGFRRDQPELRFAAQRILHVGFNAGPHLNFVQPFSARYPEPYPLQPLEANGRSPGDDAVGGLEINGDGTTAIFIARPDKPACNHQGDDGSNQNGEMRRFVLILASVGEAGVS